jgi:acyl-CoA synthetase (AMP-forming)/AMP-acid ligase II
LGGFAAVTFDSQSLRDRIEADQLPANLGALLDQAIAHFPDAPAWVFVDQGELAPLSYRRLGDMVARAANVFDGLGVRKNSHVGVMLPNLPESLAAWLAIARIGARMVPINPGYTPDELKYWLTDGDVGFLLMDASKLATFEAVEPQTPLLTRDRILMYGAEPNGSYRSWSRMMQAAPAEFTPREPVYLDDIVNIQYTSGSTGWPKGCLLSHRYWIQAGKVLHEAWPRFKRIQCDLPFYYMGPLWRFALAAFNGAALCVPPSYSLSRFRERMVEYDYDMGWATNPVVLLDPSPLERQHKLKMIAIFGLSPSLHQPLEERYGVPARDSYGMTEIGIATYTPFEDNSLVGKGSCGQVSPFRELMIADADGKALPVGETGELCVAGQGILQGYYRSPRLRLRPSEANGSARATWPGVTSLATIISSDASRT